MITNSDIKRIRSLSQKKYRRQYNQFVIEGQRLVHAALEAQAPVLEVYLTQSFSEHPLHQDLIYELDNQFIHYCVLPEKTLARLSKTSNPAGIMGICSIPELLEPDFSTKENWLFLDHISDPGNLGTILRSAAWFNVNHVALSKNCSDPFNPKVVRSGMGAHFDISLYLEFSLEQLDGRDFVILGADQKGNSIDQIIKKLETPWILVLGNEAHGISAANEKLLDYSIAIPKYGSGESLNVAVAGSILMQHLPK